MWCVLGNWSAVLVTEKLPNVLGQSWLIIIGNELYLFICFSSTLVTPFIWSSVSLNHGNFDSILWLFFLLFSVQVQMTLSGDSCCLYVRFFLLAQFLEVAVPWNVSQFNLCAKSDIFTLVTFNPLPNRCVIWEGFVFPRMYIFLDITITGINIEHYIFHPPWIYFKHIIQLIFEL